MPPEKPISWKTLRANKDFVREQVTKYADTDSVSIC